MDVCNRQRAGGRSADKHGFYVTIWCVFVYLMETARPCWCLGVLQATIKWRFWDEWCISETSEVLMFDIILKRHHHPVLLPEKKRINHWNKFNHSDALCVRSVQNGTFYGENLACSPLYTPLLTHPVNLQSTFLSEPTRPTPPPSSLEPLAVDGFHLSPELNTAEQCQFCRAVMLCFSTRYCHIKLDS